MNLGKRMKESFTNKKFKMGGFQTLTMVIVIAVVIVLNLIVGKMDITVDLSRDGVYTLSDDTKKMAEGLSRDIVIYYMCQDGNETLQTQGGKAINMERIFNLYGDFSHITVEKKDPVLYPNFASTYTEDEIQNNDVIIVDKESEKSKHVSVNDMVQTQMDYTSYSYVPTGIDVEGQVTAAIQNLTSGTTKKVYVTSGHGEQEMGVSLEDILKKGNYETETIETASADRIPEDCDLLVVYGAAYDFNESEYKLLSDYLSKGGDAAFFLDAAVKNLKNYYKLLGDYGIRAVEGCVVDSEQCYSADYPILLSATVESHDVTANAGDTNVLLANAVGMTTQSDVRGTLSVEPLLSTSEAAFSRSDFTDGDYDNLNDTDVKGPFSTAVAATDTASGTDGEAAHILVFGSYTFAGDDFIATSQFGNRSIVTDSLSWLTGGTEASTFAIAAKSLSEETVSLKVGSKVFWTVTLVVILPLALLVAGFVIWFRRRRR